MKKMSKVCGLLLAVFWLGACDANPFGKKDPLSSQPDSVKNGELPSKPKPPPQKPLASDVLRIDASDFYSFREGLEQEITISARNMFDDSQYEIEVSNLSDFKDATVTKVAGDTKAGTNASLTFKWKPPVGFVPKDTIIYPLDITVYTVNNQEKYVTTKSVPLFVYNEVNVIPEIVSISQLPTFIKENDSSKYFKVRIKDVDSDPTGTTLVPTLQLQNKSLSSSSISIAPFLRVYSTQIFDAAQSLWDITVEVNLGGLELTPLKIMGYFDIYAISARGVRSNPMSQSIFVWTSVTSPATSWGQDQTFKIGAMNRYSFTVADPKGEGQISVTSAIANQCAQLGSGASCSCQPSVGVLGKMGSAVQCTLVWMTAPDATPGRYQIIYYAVNTSPISGDTETKQAPFIGVINLVQ